MRFEYNLVVKQFKWITDQGEKLNHERIRTLKK